MRILQLFASKEILKSTSRSCPCPLCLEFVIAGRMEGLYYTVLRSKLLGMHLWPYCEDLLSKRHASKTAETL